MLPALLFCKITSNNGIHIDLSGCNFGFGFEEKYCRIGGFGEKKARIVGFAYPYSPTSEMYIIFFREETFDDGWILSISQFCCV